MTITWMSLSKVQIQIHRLNPEKQGDVYEEGCKLHQRCQVWWVSLEWSIIRGVP